MNAKLIASDSVLYYLLSALFGGILFVYVIRKLLSITYNRNKLKSSQPKSEDLNSINNNNHYKNGNAVKLNGTLKVSNCLNTNDDNNEVNEELIKCQRIVSPLQSESQISFDDSNNTSNVESIDKTSEEEVMDVFTKTQLKPREEMRLLSDLAAIILTDDNRKDWFEIICITSGSDVIDGRNLEPEFVVVDCRAPVLARRCLIRYLYRKLNELVKHEVKEEDSLFSAIPASNRFELKKNYKLSLFLSEPPENCKTNTRRHTNGPKNGKKRSGSQSVQLKSTTDKISVWNQVGVQGSLLSHFMDAIFISSVIIPVEFNQKSFHDHFILNYPKEPKLTKCDSNLIADITEQMDKLLVNNYQNLATNWIKTEDSLEVIDCKTGKAINNPINDWTADSLSVSRLSKHELNKCFRDFLANYEHNLRPHQSLPMTYRKWKESAPNYRIQKQLLKVRYAVAGRQWLCLPSDLDMFV